MAIDQTEKNRRNALSNAEATDDAQSLCAPCKLCGGAAEITDAGTGWGYYIACENSRRNKCTCGETRLSGWAYNVMELWNRLHAPTPAPREE